MVRKTSSPASETPAVAPASVAPVSTETVAAPAAPKAPKAKKSKAAPAAETPAVVEEAKPAAPAPAPAQEETPAAAPAPVAEKVDIAVRCTELNSQIQVVATQLATIRTNLKQLEKQMLKEIKTLSKGKKSKNTSGVKRPNSFETPRPICDELADFLGVEHGTLVSLVDVNKFINAYIAEHKLKNPENGHFILPDAKLATLLKVGPTDELKFFNLQTYLKPLYIKKPVVATA